MAAGVFCVRGEESRQDARTHNDYQRPTGAIDFVNAGEGPSPTRR